MSTAPAPALAGDPVTLRRPASAGRPLWESAYASALLLVDAVAVTLAGAAAVGLRTPADPTIVSSTLPALAYPTLVALLPVGWVATCAATRCYESRFLGTGSEEMKRVVAASMRFAGLLTFAAVVLQAQLSRRFVLVALTLGLLLLAAGRFSARKVLHLLRRRGYCLHRVVALGTAEEVLLLLERAQREPHNGFAVVGVALADTSPIPAELRGGAIPLLGPPRDVVARLADVRADTVAVAGSSAMSSRELRELTWQLEGSGVDVVVAPAITDVTGPRIHIRPVAGLPLLHVEEPTFGGARKLVKGAIDVAGALVLLLLLALPLLLIALLVRLDSPGPVFYRQERIGRDGRPFRIWKFRTMRVGADRELPALAALNEQSGPLFKIRADPRITPIGARLRRKSLDELPQLVNVLCGSMSLVGPRPPLASEVAEYAEHVHRRLLVKPGMTGLWQVSGRNDLEWEEAVRLDLYYVENWSVLLDAMILWKTLFAVVRGHGAY